MFVSYEDTLYVPTTPIATTYPKKFVITLTMNRIVLGKDQRRFNFNDIIMWPISIENMPSSFILSVINFAFSVAGFRVFLIRFQ